MKLLIEKCLLTESDIRLIIKHLYIINFLLGNKSINIAIEYFSDRISKQEINDIKKEVDKLVL